MGGAVYEAEFQGARLVGWLCPALLKYFPSPPDRIYVAIEPIVRKRVGLLGLFDRLWEAIRPWPASVL